MNVTWLPEAEAELNLAAGWYEHRLLHLGARFVSEVLALIEQLALAPRTRALVRGTAGKRGARRALVQCFPYALIYALTDADELVVIALLHTRRGRTSWRGRLS